MSNVAQLASLSLTSLVSVFNSAVENHAPEGFAPVKKFASKDAAVARIEKLVAAIPGAEVLQTPDGFGVFAPEAADMAGADGCVDAAHEEFAPAEGEVETAPHDPADEGDVEGPVDYDADGAGVDPLEDAEGEAEPAAEAPFVKASKEELTAMDAATRAAYRKARRQAARRARKGKVAVAA